jgi:hypothetical protein
MLLTKAFSSPAPASATYRHGDDYFLDCDEAWLHEDALEQDGGQTCNDTELINSQRRCATWQNAAAVAAVALACRKRHHVLNVTKAPCVDCHTRACP